MTTKDRRWRLMCSQKKDMQPFSCSRLLYHLLEDEAIIREEENVALFEAGFLCQPRAADLR